MSIDPEKDLELMKLAVELSKKSQSENDGRIHPLVGAVIATKNGEIIATGYRGQHTLGNHAEQEALVGLNEDLVADSVVYSTLEPCTFRGKQTPCCLRLLDRRISEVVIGILDPNREIRGRGEWKFEERGVAVRKFHPGLVQEIHRLNRDFIEDQLGPGIMITTLQPQDGDEIAVNEHHRAGREILEVAKNKLAVQGIYRNKPSPGDSISIFVRDGRTYYPQAPINFDFDQDNSLWKCPAVWLNPKSAPVDYDIIVARESDDFKIVTAHYSKVHNDLLKLHKIDDWIGFDMHPIPPGFRPLATLSVRRAQIVQSQPKVI